MENSLLVINLIIFLGRIGIRVVVLNFSHSPSHAEASVQDQVHLERTTQRIHAVVKQLQAQDITVNLVKVTKVQLRDCVACYGCFKNADRLCSVKIDRFNDYLTRMTAADGIVIGCSRDQADSHSLRALIDRTSFVVRANDNLFSGKVGMAVVGLPKGHTDPVLERINHFYKICQMVQPSSPGWQKSLEGFEDIAQWEPGQQMAHVLHNQVR